MDGLVTDSTGHGGTATERASGNATEHAAVTGTERAGGTATEHAAESTTERATAACTEFDLLSDVVMTSADERKTYPILEVAFKKDMWWSMPPWLSQAIYNEYAAGRNVGYTWDWGGACSGSYSPGGEGTSINRYTIDFNQMIQTNSDNNRKRSVRWIWICADDAAPAWSGQIPQCGD